MRTKPIRLENAKPEMVVASAVTNQKGMVLCGEGTVLTDRLIARLEQMGVLTVVVQDLEEMSDKDYLRQKENIERRFAQIDPKSLLGKLKQAMIANLESGRN